MYPTLEEGDLLFVRNKHPNNGDIVIIKHHVGTLVKRVSAQSNNTIPLLLQPFLGENQTYDFKIPAKDSLYSSTNYWKNQLLEDVNIKFPMKKTIPEIENEFGYKSVENYYFVIGDNLLNSNDSRDFGLIKESEIEGVAIKLSISEIFNILFH